MATEALIVVDYQNDFAEGGSLAVNGARALAPEILNQMRLTKSRSGLVLATRDWHPARSVHFDNWPVHCVANTPGAEYVSGIDPSLIDVEIFKGFKDSDDGYSGFEGVSVLEWDAENGFEVSANAKTIEQVLREANVRSVRILGLATDFCVFATARDAQRLGFDTTVLRSGIAAVNVPGLPSGEEKLQELMASWVKVA